MPNSPENGHELIRLVLDELPDLRGHGPSTHELDVAMENLKHIIAVWAEAPSATGYRKPVIRNGLLSVYLSEAGA